MFTNLLTFPCKQVPSSIRKLQLGFFGSEISSVAAPNQMNYSLLSSILTQIMRLSNSDEYGKNGRPIFQKMQYCILRVLRSNFLRGHEQLKDSDDIGLIYFPLNPPNLLNSHAQSSLSFDGKEVENENENEHENGKESGRGAGRDSNRGNITNFNHLLVFQLLRSVLQSVSGIITYYSYDIYCYYYCFNY